MIAEAIMIPEIAVFLLLFAQNRKIWLYDTISLTLHGIINISEF